jgi:putative sigma-54 modulation protein
MIRARRVVAQRRAKMFRALRRVWIHLHWERQPHFILSQNMKTSETLDTGTKFILRGINLPLTDAMKSAFEKKAERLFRHETRIDRLRIDIEEKTNRGVRAFTAKGHIEISGPDLLVSATSDDAYKSVDLLVDRLDRQLRKRTTALTARRYAGDVRELRAAASVSG